MQATNTDSNVSSALNLIPILVYGQLSVQALPQGVSGKKGQEHCLSWRQGF